MSEEQRARDAMMADTNWRIEKKINPALIGVILVQTFAIGVWTARLDSRVTYLEANRVEVAPFAVLSEKMTQVQANVAETKQDIGSVKSDIGSVRDGQAGMKQDILGLKEEIRRSGFKGGR